MKWFKKTIANWLLEGLYNEEPQGQETYNRISNRIPKGMVPSTGEDDNISWHEGLNIRIKAVIGGKLVSFRTYDRMKDLNNERIYIITNDQSFDQELCKIITMESMRAG